MDKIKILLACDETSFLEELSITLSWEGYDVLIRGGNGSLLAFITTYHPDLIIFNLDGANSNEIDFKFCKELRPDIKCPIIVLSEKNDDDNWIKALTSCADNYIVKPFTNDWFLAVVRASLRLWLAYKNGSKIPDHDIDRVDLVINYDIRKVILRGEKVDLTPLEFSTLYYLAKNDGRVISHKELMHIVWGAKDRDASQLRSLIYQVRQKIEIDPTKPEYIITVPGFGYRLNAKVLSEMK